MAQINPHWARWIAASLAVYFKTVADNAGITLLVEGIDERESEKMEVDRAELRINGPFIRQLSEGYFRLDVDTNILLTDLMGGEVENPYNLMTCKPLCGWWLAARTGQRKESPPSSLASVA